MNILADAYGPGTMGLKNGSDLFFITSAIFALCKFLFPVNPFQINIIFTGIILLHTFWSVIFFDGVQTRNRARLAYVVVSHLLFSCFTLINTSELYGVTISLSIANLILTMIVAFKSVGGTTLKFKRFISCQQ